MAHPVLRGILTGAAASVLGLTVLAIISAPKDGFVPQATEEPKVEPDRAAAPEAPGEESLATPSGETQPVETADTPQAPAVAPEAETPAAALAESDAPEVGGASVASLAPPQEDSAAPVTATMDAEGTGDSPQSPGAGSDEEPPQSAEAPQSPEAAAPGVAEAAIPAEEAAPAPSGEEAQSPSAGQPALRETPEPTAEASPEPGDMPRVPVSADDVDAETPAPETAPAAQDAETSSLEEVETTPAEEEGPLPTDVTETAPEETAEADDGEGATEQEADEADPAKPRVGFGSRETGVTSGRLPTIGGGTEDEAPAAEEAEADAEAPAEPSPLAIERNAAAFEAPGDRPLLSVVLIDPGEGRTALGDLGNLPFPVSFILPMDTPDLAEAIAFYRAAGGEVVLEFTLPQGAMPVDAEVAFQAWAGSLNEAVAVIPDAQSDFQSSGATARQVAEILVGSGHGLISHPQGLNTGHKSALKAGVPAGLVFRVLDDDGQSGAVIRRFMDNAAFKARQEEGVILLGHARPETIQALIEWSLGNRAASVAMVPVSAVLLGE